ncbi:MAG TPA: TRL domain-containing protein [Planctomycetota bacterium]|nr:TRL domain-containing protein [Planctomycetota bacterium]
MHTRSPRASALLLVLAGLLPLGSGCASPDNAGHGLLAAKVRGTLQAGTLPPPAEPVEGRSESYSFLYLFAYGDASLDAAIRDGGLRRVHHVDWEYKSLLCGLLAVHTTIAVGER